MSPLADAGSRSPGRFYFWSERALYLGPGLPAAVHAHHAVQVCIPLAGGVRLRTGPGARWRRYAGAVIPSNVNHESDEAVPLIAALWLEPESADARRLSRARTAILSVGTVALARTMPLLLGAWRDRCDSERAAQVTAEVVRLLLPRAGRPQALDARVERALAIQGAAPDRRISLAATAAGVALSPSRLAHLFTPAVGIPPRRRLLWLRLRDGIKALADGASITTAAHAAGFADAAHLSRTFRRMLGFSPSAALHISQFVQDAPSTHW